MAGGEIEAGSGPKGSENEVRVFEKNGGRTEIFFGDSGVNMVVVKKNGKDVWYHNFTPEGRMSHTKNSAIEFTRRYTKGLLLLLDWWNAPEAVLDKLRMIAERYN